MKTSIFALGLAIALGGSAFAQEKTIKIGVLTDNSGLYADVAGPGATLATKMAVEDSGLAAKGWKIEVISADHQNKPDIATSIARQWIDVEKIDVIVDAVNSGAGLAINTVTKEKNKVLLANGPASSELTNGQCAPGTVHWAYDT